MSEIVRIEVSNTGNADEMELAVLALRRELADLACVHGIETTPTNAPHSAKSSGGAELGILLASVSGGAGAVRYLMLFLRDWLRRNTNKHVKIEIGNKTLDLSGLSEPAIERLVQEWYGGDD